MAKADLYTMKGNKTKVINLPSDFGQEINMSLVAQAMRVYEDRSHVGFAKTKTRGEVIRTKKKIYRQKGTGGARHGARSAPIYVGGGIAHGPRPVKRVLSLPAKLKRKALNMALSSKAADGGLIVVEGLSKVKKTKEVSEFLKKASKDMNFKRFTFVLADDKKDTAGFTRNLKNTNTYFKKDLNAYNIYLGGLVILDADLVGNIKTENTTSKTKMKTSAKLKDKSGKKVTNATRRTTK